MNVRAKIEETAYMKDFAIYYGGKPGAVALINMLADRRRKVVHITDEIPDERPGEELSEYLEKKITETINEQQIIQYETDFHAVEFMQAKSAFALENHQRAKTVFEENIKEIDQMIAKFQMTIGENGYIPQIPQYMYCHYTTSCDLLKALESRKNVSNCMREIIKKHRRYVLEFESYLKCFQHVLYSKTLDCYEQELLKTMKTIIQKENAIRRRTLRIAKLHANSGKVDSVQVWNANIEEYQYAFKFVRCLEKRNPKILTPKAIRLLFKHKSFVANFQTEVNAIENNFCYLDKDNNELNDENDEDDPNEEDNVDNGETGLYKDESNQNEDDDDEVKQMLGF